MKKLVTLLTKEKRAKINRKMTPTFFQLSAIVYKKLGRFFFHTLLANLFKQRYTSSIASYKYLNKLISEV